MSSWPRASQSIRFPCNRIMSTTFSTLVARRGFPKGVVRGTGGYAVNLKHSMGSFFNLKRGECMWAASDIGWIVGLSYIMYGPLWNGSTTIFVRRQAGKHSGCRSVLESHGRGTSSHTESESSSRACFIIYRIISLYGLEPDTTVFCLPKMAAGRLCKKFKSFQKYSLVSERAVGHFFCDPSQNLPCFHEKTK